MMIPLAYLLYAYLGFLMIWFLFFLICLYHLVKYGYRGIMTVLTGFIFIGGAIFILNSSYLSIMDGSIDWQSSAASFEFLSTSRLK